MSIFPHDIETKSTANLKDVGLYNYATHPSTEILCVGYRLDGEPIRIWRPGEPVPKAWEVAAHDPDVTAVAHNAPFEMAIEQHILSKRHGFPLIPRERYVCTMAMANALALPASLDKLAQALGLSWQKDKVGHRVMLQMTKPRRSRKAEDPSKIYWYDDAERMSKLESYCCDDVAVSGAVAEELPWLSADEYDIWLLDQRINQRGIHIDRKLALAAQQIIDAAGPYINDELYRLTNGQVETINQVAKLSGWLAQYTPIDSLDKAAIEELLERDLPPVARRAVELRFLGAQAAVKKVNPLLEHCDANDRVHNAFVYHAAGTGRWSSRGVQLHNLKRVDTELVEDVAKAVRVIGTGDFDRARKEYGNPLAIIGSLIRAMITAAPGCMLLGADFSGIEARVTAWLAGEMSKLAAFRAYDAGKGPDPYIIAAAWIFGIDASQLEADCKLKLPAAKAMRQVGKACELAFGFQGGLGAYKKFDPDTSFTDEEIHKFKNTWRKNHPNIEAMWSNLNTAAYRAVRNPGQRWISKRYRLAFECDHNGYFWITLPSKRRLCYPEARICQVWTPPGTGLVLETERGGTPTLIFKDNASGQWRDVKIYGGLLTENLAQAISRDLLAEAMLRLDRAGFPIVGHVHDETVCEVKQSEVNKQKPEFQRLMTVVPDWADGLPIVAKAWTDTRYVK